MGGTVFQKPYAHLHINRFFSFSKNEPTRIFHTHTHAKKNSLQSASNDIDNIPK